MKRVLGLSLAVMLVLGSVFTASAQDVSVAMASANYKEGKGSIYSWCGYPGPCKVPTSALVLLEKQGPCEVIVGDCFSYQIQISNRSAVDLIAVVLDDWLPEGMVIDNIEPQPDSQSGNKVTWNLGTIPAKSAKIITVTGRAMQVGCLVSNALAKICYELPLPLATRVVECNVAIQKTLPECVTLCDIIPMCITVTNCGSAPATNVCITDKLPEGLVTVDGKTEFSINVGTLKCGETKTFTVDLKACRTGEFTNTACVTADRNCYATSSATVKVVQAELELVAAGPANAYICTSVPYQITVRNVSNTPACDVILTDCITGNFKIESVSDGGKVNRNRVAWNLGTINPGESRTVCLTGMSTVEGVVRSDFEVTGRCLEPKKASHCLTLVGVPGVLTSVKDNCDPVKVCDNVTYTITASNTGSRVSNNLRYTIKLDDGMDFVSGAGTTGVTQVDAKTLSFAPLASLPVGATASWNVTVNATSAGDKRFTAELITDELTAPVSKSESTNFYEQNMTYVMAQ